MIYVETPLTDAMRRSVEEAWGRGVDGDAVRLHGGEESAAYRLGDVVLRVGPEWRSAAEAEWCHGVAVHAALTLPEAVAPIPARGGATVLRVDGRPLSLWPYVEGAWPDSDRPWVCAEGARLLARLHRSLVSFRPPPRPVAASVEIGLYGEPPRDVPYLADPELDRWLADFHARGLARHALHGDFYAGNTLASEGRLVAVLDWDEAIVGAPELEVAWAAMEWADEYGGSPTLLRRFVADYHRAGGTAGDMDDRMIAQLIRHRLRREAAYFEGARKRGVEHDEEGLDYHKRRVEAFFDLAP
ncbi:Ser/Thr protein kinase RdoA involved in Cpx stress response, MazF antagonist [Sinosporangium album]|uniref:Ser/Thr protein kinase RdoA involved in Cpx stress response, MazF antagonist n=1 Tax=Sinosporangium album TaxID=504805 RepID=A0A1G7XZL6_9ACTN|nr:phosphotransferase [Sinosporangium album]SDG89614.1 Ser/Thr protein kinase RdoA involved in Cpx stress response, MazF antagonist [Sinosporangium album]